MNLWRVLLRPVSSFLAEPSYRGIRIVRGGKK